jgi:hypothetical protein
MPESAIALITAPVGFSEVDGLGSLPIPFRKLGPSREPRAACACALPEACDGAAGFAGPGFAGAGFAGAGLAAALGGAGLG